MVGKSVVTGALVSGAVLAAPAAAETSLRRLTQADVGNTYDQETTLEATFTELPPNLAAGDSFTYANFRAAVEGALEGTGDIVDDSSATVDVPEAGVGTDLNMSITAVHGNTVTFQYTPAFAGSLTISTASKTALGEHLGADGIGSEEFRRRFAALFAQRESNFYAPYIIPASNWTRMTGGSLQLSFQLDENFVVADVTEAFQTTVWEKIRETLDMTALCTNPNADECLRPCSNADECLYGVTTPVVVGGNGIKFSFIIEPHIITDHEPSELDDKWHDLTLIFSPFPSTSSYQQDLRDAFRLEVACRLKGEDLPTGMSWANTAPSQTICDEILGTTAAAGNDTGSTDDSTEESGESTDESSSARSVAVVSFLSTAAAAAALF